MPSPIRAFYEDLDEAKLRIEPPKKFVFLCGGTIGADGSTSAESLRDYLCRIRSFSSDVHGEIVRAETATQLYRDTAYDDLITFEEDIARIATVVLVIAESAGSLAELGAFASNTTRNALRIIVQETYWTQESFIRFGPLKRISDDSSDNVGVYPWEVDEARNIVLSSADPHYDEIVKFVNRHLNAASNSQIFPEDKGIRNFYIIYWILFLGMALSLKSILKIAEEIVPNIKQTEIKNKIYCMMIAGWVGSKTYSNKTYFYAQYDKDPFDYAFKSGVTDTDSPRRKLEVSQALIAAEDAPELVRKFAFNERKSP